MTGVAAAGETIPGGERGGVAKLSRLFRRRLAGP
jgi:hypothetical protein